MRHRLAHKLGLNMGKVATWWSDEGVMVAFVCSTCGKLSHVHLAAVLMEHGYDG